MTNSLLSLVSIFALGFSSQAHAQAKVLINGAGATFPAPIYTKWFQDYNKKNPSVEINYQAIGSGGGIKQLTEKTVDFGASDSPMSDEELKRVSGPVLHIPTVLGAVAVTYNVAGVKTGLKLDGPTLADIFAGKIMKWNDPKIAGLNPGAALPATQVVVIYRSDSSGTTAVFTEYLAKVSPTWAKEIGKGKTVKWPMGLGGKGNEGVTGQIKNTAGSIGYVELTYAESEKMPVVEIKNKAGQFVAPSLKSVSEAADSSLKTMPADFRVSITDTEGKTAYPISAFTYLLVYQNMPGAKGAELVKFLNWSMAEGQKSAPALHYAALPKSLITKVSEKIKTISSK